jgi:hypothetical protein
MREDERERRDLRVQRRAAPGDRLIRKGMGDTLQRTEPVPDAMKLFGDHRDAQLVSVLGTVISITRRQLRKELAEELAERDPQLRKIAALEAAAPCRSSLRRRRSTWQLLVGGGLCLLRW